MSKTQNFVLFLMGAAALFFFFVPSAFAQDAAEAAASAGALALGMKYIGAGLAVGVAAMGGGIGQGSAARGALEGIARNPSAYGKIFTPLIISLALVESLVIYGLLVSLLLIFAV